jgi:hypothetical protein
VELIFLLVLFFVASLVQQASQKKNRPRRPQPRRGPRVEGSPGPEAEVPQTIRDLMAEVRRSMEEAERRARGEPEPVEEDDEEFEEDFVEERTSLEEPAPEVRSLEVEVRRPERPVIDYDRQAGQVIRQRLQWADRARRGRRPGDHADFDERIRQPDQEAAPVPDRSPAFRRALIWKEILDRPAALRRDWPASGWP